MYDERLERPGMPLYNDFSWICQKCCWFNGIDHCKESEVRNHDEGNCINVCECSGFVEMTEVL